MYKRDREEKFPVKSLDKLLREAAELREIKFRVEKKEKKYGWKEGYYSSWFIVGTLDKIINWDGSVHLYVRRRKGRWSKEEAKLQKIRSKYFGYQLLLEPGFSDSKKSDVNERVRRGTHLINELINEYLGVLRSFQKETSVGISFDAAVKAVLSHKQISLPIKHKIVGNIVAQEIIASMWQIAKGLELNYKLSNDDIQSMAVVLQKAKNRKVQMFFQRNFAKCTVADRARNKSCHAWEKAPSPAEIKLCVELLADIQKFKS